MPPEEIEFVEAEILSDEQYKAGRRGGYKNCLLALVEGIRPATKEQEARYLYLKSIIDSIESIETKTT